MNTFTPTLSIHSSSGYTLIELMVAMVLGLFLMTGVFQLNLSNQKTSRLQKSVTEIQKNGRFAIDSLAYAIKTAGYSGFYKDLSIGVENLLNTPNDEVWDISIPVSGYNNVNTTDVIAGVTGFTGNTDVLLLKGMSQNTISVINNMAPGNLVIEDDNTFIAGDIVVISDIDQASLFQIDTAITAGSQTTLTLATGGVSPGNSATLLNSYNAQAEIAKLDTQMFYIKNGQNGLPALFKTTLFNNSGVPQLQEVELASNVSDLQISYSVDNNKDNIVDLSQDASAVANWNQVIGINIALLAISNKDNVLPEKNSYSFDANRVTFSKDSTASVNADRHLKRVFRSYMRLRNRVL